MSWELCRIILTIAGVLASEIVGDLPFVNVCPPEVVLFVCEHNLVTLRGRQAYLFSFALICCLLSIFGISAGREVMSDLVVAGYH